MSGIIIFIGILLLISVMGFSNFIKNLLLIVGFVVVCWILFCTLIYVTQYEGSRTLFESLTFQFSNFWDN